MFNGKAEKRLDRDESVKYQWPSERISTTPTRKPRKRFGRILAVENRCIRLLHFRFLQLTIGNFRRRFTLTKPFLPCLHCSGEREKGNVQRGSVYFLCPWMSVTLSLLSLSCQCKLWRIVCKLWLSWNHTTCTSSSTSRRGREQIHFHGNCVSLFSAHGWILLCRIDDLHSTHRWVEWIWWFPWEEIEHLRS